MIGRVVHESLVQRSEIRSNTPRNQDRVAVHRVRSPVCSIWVEQRQTERSTAVATHQSAIGRPGRPRLVRRTDDDRLVGVASRNSDEHFDRIIFEDDIVIQPQEEIRIEFLRVTFGQESSSRPIQVPSPLDEMNVRISRANRFSGAVRTGVIDEENLENDLGRQNLMRQPFQTAKRRLATVVTGDQNCDGLAHGWTRAFTRLVRSTHAADQVVRLLDRTASAHAGQRENGISVSAVDVPVLLLAFNRPEQTAQVVDAIRTWNISRLYVAADGPRPNRGEDVALCQRTRSLILDELAHLDIETLFRDRNLGCGQAVSSAIDWFFDNEEAGIILEDDCVPDASFLPFCQELLDRYRDSPEVMMISGNNFLFDSPMPPDEYRFLGHTHVWGWATWRRAWKHYDFSMGRWPALRATTWLAEVCGGHADAERYWRQTFDDVHSGINDTWDHQWTYSMWLRNGLSITPGRNLVTNIGFHDQATHTPDRPSWYTRVIHGAIEFPLRHPETIRSDPALDRWTNVHIWRTRSLWYRSGRRIARLSRKFQLESRIRYVYRRAVNATRRHAGPPGRNRKTETTP